LADLIAIGAHRQRQRTLGLAPFPRITPRVDSA
jgi:hypothetical protein